MVRLSKEQFAKARRFMETGARKLERALFAYEFGEGTALAVHAELARYQNGDGGFGHGLEADLRSEASSALATTVALQILTAMKDRNETMIRQAMQYLYDTYIEERKGWDIIPEAAAEAPRAIWWEYGAFRDHWGNPSAEIAGYFNLYPNAASKDWVKRLNEHAADYLRGQCDLKEMHEMFCYWRWAETLPESAMDEVADTLDEFLDNCIVSDPAERQGYGAVPLQVVEGPESRLFAKYEDVIPGDLDSLIESQGDDGTWGPNWSWGRYDAEWENAKAEWRGVMTLHTLRTLRNFGRLQAGI